MPQTTLRPVTPITETVADISISGQYVHISFLERDDKFREVIKNKGLSLNYTKKKQRRFLEELS